MAILDLTQSQIIVALYTHDVVLFGNAEGDKQPRKLKFIQSFYIF